MAWRARHSRRLEDVEIDALGEPIALPTRSGGVRLHLPPGRCALRTLNVGGMSGKEIRPALMLCAEGSLPYPARALRHRQLADRRRAVSLWRRCHGSRWSTPGGSCGRPIPTVAAISVPELRPPRRPAPVAGALVTGARRSVGLPVARPGARPLAEFPAREHPGRAVVGAAGRRRRTRLPEAIYVRLVTLRSRRRSRPLPSELATALAAGPS